MPTHSASQESVQSSPARTKQPSVSSRSNICSSNTGQQMHVRSPFHRRTDPRRNTAADTSPLTGSEQKAGIRRHPLRTRVKTPHRSPRVEISQQLPGNAEQEADNGAPKDQGRPIPLRAPLPSTPRVGHELSTRPFAAHSTKRARFPSPHRVPHEALEAEALLLGGVARDDERLRLLAGPGRPRGRGRRHFPVPQRPAHFRRHRARR